MTLFVLDDGFGAREAGHGFWVTQMAAETFNGPVVQIDTGSSVSGIRGVIGLLQSGAIDRAVVNLSWGIPQAHPGLRSALQDLRDRGGIVVVAAGNDSSEDLNFPASYEDVWTIGTIDSISNYGRGVDYVVDAPWANLSGADIAARVSAGADTQAILGEDSSRFFARLQRVASATSLGAPFFAGTVAEMLRRDPTLSEDAIATALDSTGSVRIRRGTDPQVSNKMVNAPEAIAEVSCVD